jgi:hypothetical protein
VKLLEALGCRIGATRSRIILMEPELEPHETGLAEWQRKDFTLIPVLNIGTPFLDLIFCCL